MDILSRTLASFGFLCAVGGPISLLLVVGFAVSAARETWEQRRRLVAPRIPCGQALGQLGRRVAVEGHVVLEEPLRDPITGESVVHYDIQVGRTGAIDREIVLASVSSPYGLAASDHVWRDTRSVRFRLRDETGEVAVEPEAMTWVDMATVLEEDHREEREAYLREHAVHDAQWVIHRRVLAGTQVVVVGVVGRATATEHGYRGGTTELAQVFGPGTLQGSGLDAARLVQRGWGGWASREPQERESRPTRRS